MQDTKLFETILGITAPWHIARVELTTEDKRVDLWLEHVPRPEPDPARQHVVGQVGMHP